MRIRSYLLLLAALVLVPGFVAATIAVERLREGERDAALRGLSETARATALLVDGQVQRSMGALSVLANSSAMHAEDLEAFYTEAASIDRASDVWTTLLDDAGAQRLNTRLPYGAPLSNDTCASVSVAQVLAQPQPLVTGVYRGPASGQLLTRIYVPAKPTRTGRRHVVAHSIPVEHWKKTALRPQVRADWVVAVIDRDGRFISRSHDADERVGTPARPELVAAAAASQEGLIRHATLEGTDSFDAFTHSPLTGWTVAVAAPVVTIEASASKAVVFLGGGVAMALVAALISASMLSRRLIRAMDDVSSAAAALGRGEAPPLVTTSVREVKALNFAFAEAGALLAAEKRALELVEAERARLLENERSARVAAQAENTAKDQFLALLGHELRNPLSAIAGATEVLSGTSDPKAARWLAILRRQNRHLKHIVDDLLEVSRMLSGKIVLDTAPIDLGAARCCSLQVHDHGSRKRPTDGLHHRSRAGRRHRATPRAGDAGEPRSSQRG